MHHGTLGTATQAVFSERHLQQSVTGSQGEVLRAYETTGVPASALRLQHTTAQHSGGGGSGCQW
ncbi:hypothetical protein E2C01_032453 [Portunus trituberculatus]|uniref:Uncharacterized protein n=1 Tax=Portunus trituberculatus TaxID=210409 RepID=A0A5B7EZN4_PORTR|nr:hypothetical protein [Portunus trituberculatus]